jgi:DNA polymerase
MSLITLDFETYYTDKLGFSKQTTEEYIRDSQFEIIGVGITQGDDPATWLSGSKEEIREHLLTYDWDNSALLCHNTMFDGAILKWVLGIEPAFYLDTLCMARAIHGVEAGGSLAALARRYNIGEKGTEVAAAKGKRRADFTPLELEAYGAYCKNDAELTRKLFYILSNNFSEDETRLIDMTLRMYIDPVFLVDDALLVTRLEELKREKLELLSTLMNKLSCDTEEAVRKKLASNKQFAEILKSFGIEPPMKTSPATGKPTLALAKNDEGFIALTENEDVFIQELCAVRLGTKSTLEESRIERFIDIGKRNKGKLPIPLKYYGAHTGRWSGSDKVNFQNLPSRDKKKKTLKNAVTAPDGHLIINCDSSQIEARVLAWLAGQEDVTIAFRDARDVYCEFATKVYKRDITKADPVERFVGKTCILGLGYGTGWRKLQHTLKTSPPGASLSDEECERIVSLYRESNDKITELWGECERALKSLIAWPEGRKNYYLGQNKALVITPEGIRLPNRLYIRYPDLQVKDGKYVYNSRKGEISLWGGAIVENVVQALARIVVGEQMLKISQKYPVALTVHDAAVCVVPEGEIKEAVKFVTDIMSTTPDWAKTLPVACEAKYAYSYGSC